MLPAPCCWVLLLGSFWPRSHTFALPLPITSTGTCECSSCRPCSRQLRRRRFYCSPLLKLPACLPVGAAVKQMNNINNCKGTDTYTHTHTPAHLHMQRHTLTCNHTRMQSEVNRSVCCILKGAARATKSLLSLRIPPLPRLDLTRHDSTRAQAESFVSAEARLMSAAHRKQFKVSCQCKFPQLNARQARPLSNVATTAATIATITMGWPHLITYLQQSINAEALESLS